MTNEPSFLHKDLVLNTYFDTQMLELAQELNDKYPNLSLAHIPVENRGPEDDRPFAIVQIDSEGNIQNVILRLHQLEVHGAYIFNWLYANDSQRVDPWQKYLQTVEQERIAKEKADTEKINEMAEKVHAIAKSPLHTYRINDRKIGTDNYEPRVGQNAG